MISLQTSRSYQIPSIDTIVVESGLTSGTRAIGPNAQIKYSTDLFSGGTILLFLFYSLVTDKISKDWAMALCSVIHNAAESIQCSTFPNTKAEFERAYNEIRNANPENMGTGMYDYNHKTSHFCGMCHKTTQIQKYIHKTIYFCYSPKL